MARNTLTVQVTDPPAADVTFTAPSGSGTNNGVEVAHTAAAPVIVLCKNDSGAPIDVTVPANGASTQGILIPDQTFSVGAGDVSYFWLPPSYYSTAGKIGLDVSSATDVTFAAIKAGPFA
ncbi:MAG TPA: hypothetical protein VIV56_07305 [Gemmatimonadales bacterium]